MICLSQVSSQQIDEESLRQPLIKLTNGVELNNTNNNICKDSNITLNEKGLNKDLIMKNLNGKALIGNGNLNKTEEKNGEQIENVNEISDMSNDSKNIDHKPPKEEKSIPVYGKYKVWYWEFETPIIWYSVFFIAVWHILAVYVVLTYPLREKIPLAIYSIWVGGMSGFGITAGAHRYFTHKAFKTKLPLKLILLLCYSVAGQNTLFDWVRDHRVHHKFSETDADPHNSKRGFFFAHVGWLMMRKHPEVIKKGRTLDLSDLTDDPIIKFHVKNWIFFKLFFCFILPSSIPPLLWGESWYHSIAVICFVRYILSLNATWAVNSFAHLYGNRPYDKKIYPVENLTVSFCTMGEGYHNYHHTFPWDYRAAELGMMLNVTTLWLNFFHKIGWAYDLKAPSSELIKKVAINQGDGTHYRWGHEIPETAERNIEEVRKNQ